MQVADLLTREPDTITAGDTATWRRSYSPFPASVWTLTYCLAKRGGPTDAPLTFSGTADGDEHLISVPRGTTATWPPGDYDGQGYVADGTQRFQVWRGTIKISPNFAAGQIEDTRTPTRRIFEAVEFAIEKRSGKTLGEWTVESAAFKLIPIADLITLRDRYFTLVRQEDEAAKVAAGQATGRRILTVFTRPE
jgi:hypothetical protein